MMTANSFCSWKTSHVCSTFLRGHTCSPSRLSASMPASTHTAFNCAPLKSSQDLANSSKFTSPFQERTSGEDNTIPQWRWSATATAATTEKICVLLQDDGRQNTATISHEDTSNVRQGCYSIDTVCSKFLAAWGMRRSCNTKGRRTSMTLIDDSFGIEHIQNNISGTIQFAANHATGKRRERSTQHQGHMPV